MAENDNDEQLNAAVEESLEEDSALEEGVPENEDSDGEGVEGDSMLTSGAGSSTSACVFGRASVCNGSFSDSLTTCSTSVFGCTLLKICTRHSNGMRNLHEKAFFLRNPCTNVTASRRFNLSQMSAAFIPLSLANLSTLTPGLSLQVKGSCHAEH